MGIIRPKGPPCKNQVTGQLVQYSSVEDDGYFEKGYARKYVALSAGQYAGTTNITVNAKTIAMENACVKDQNSGLMWMKYTPDSDIGPNNNGTLLWIDATNHEDIFTFCDAANAAELAGHNDWRVPNIFELSSLVVFDAGIGGPFIDTAYFQCINSFYFSSTTYPSDSLSAMQVYFVNCYTYTVTKSTALYVRLVRGG